MKSKFSKRYFQRGAEVEMDGTGAPGSKLNILDCSGLFFEQQKGVIYCKKYSSYKLHFKLPQISNPMILDILKGCLVNYELSVNNIKHALSSQEYSALSSMLTFDEFPQN